MIKPRRIHVDFGYQRAQNPTRMNAKWQAVEEPNTGRYLTLPIVHLSFNPKKHRWNVGQRERLERILVFVRHQILIEQQDLNEQDGDEEASSNPREQYRAADFQSDSFTHCVVFVYERLEG